MNKLKELILELCPDGVEFVNLESVADILKGIQFNKINMKNSGTYPVINGGIDPSGFIEKYNQLENTITISQGGASAGFVNWISTKFWAGAHCYIIKPRDQVLNRYLFHSLKSQEENLQKSQYGAGIPALAKSTLESCQIPVPPVEIQTEIVSILDKFTSLISLLQAELDLRKKQYKFYRDKLLTFDSDVEFKNLGQCCKILDNLRRPVTRSNRISGIYPYYGANGIQDYVSDYIFDGSFVLVGEDGSVITKNGTPIVNYASGKIWVNNHAHVISEKDGVLLRYLFHYLQIVDVKKLVHGNIPKLTSTDFREIKIPIPSIEKQKKIVDILDRFDSLCNDLTSGIPAEINARKKQYKFYRDKLLTFKESD